jgi:hypothetical protein
MIPATRVRIYEALIVACVVVAACFWIAAQTITAHDAPTLALPHYLDVRVPPEKVVVFVDRAGEPVGRCYHWPDLVLLSEPRRAAERVVDVWCESVKWSDWK